MKDYCLILITFLCCLLLLYLFIILLPQYGIYLNPHLPNIPIKPILL